jgi:hypothetical protein
VPALPAQVERRGILLAALGAFHGRARRSGAQEGFDDVLRARRVGGIVDPDLRERCVDRQLAGEARGVRVEDACANAAMGEEVDQEVRLGKVGGGVDALQNFTETVTPSPSSLMPVRDCVV